MKINSLTERCLRYHSLFFTDEMINNIVFKLKNAISPFTEDFSDVIDDSVI